MSAHMLYESICASVATISDCRPGFPPDPNRSSRTRSVPPAPPPRGRFFLRHRSADNRLSRLLHAHVCFGHGISRGTERVADRLVGVEIDLPIVIGVRVGPHGENGAPLVEVDHLDVGRRL